jgi:hypothetical protein
LKFLLAADVVVAAFASLLVILPFAGFASIQFSAFMADFTIRPFIALFASFASVLARFYVLPSVFAIGAYYS